MKMRPVQLGWAAQQIKEIRFVRSKKKQMQLGKEMVKMTRLKTWSDSPSILRNKQKKMAINLMINIKGLTRRRERKLSGKALIMSCQDVDLADRNNWNIQKISAKWLSMNSNEMNKKKCSKSEKRAKRGSICSFKAQLLKTTKNQYSITRMPSALAAPTSMTINLSQVSKLISRTENQIKVLQISQVQALAKIIKAVTWNCNLYLKKILRVKKWKWQLLPIIKLKFSRIRNTRKTRLMICTGLRKTEWPLCSQMRIKNQNNQRRFSWVRKTRRSKCQKLWGILAQKTRINNRMQTWKIMINALKRRRLKINHWLMSTRGLRLFIPKSWVMPKHEQDLILKLLPITAIDQLKTKYRIKNVHRVQRQKIKRILIMQKSSHNHYRKSQI